MSTRETMEEKISQWRELIARRAAIATADVDELESHLREQIDELLRAGLSEDEALLIAITRLGALDDISREYAQEHNDRLWRQLVLDNGALNSPSKSGGIVALVMATISGLVLVVPSLAGAQEHSWFYRLFFVSILAFLALYFLLRRKSNTKIAAAVATTVLVAGLLLALYPFKGEITQVLATAHAAVALWLIVGVAYCDRQWISTRRRMDFLRFTGEWFVYMALFALGGGIFIGILVALFGVIGIDASEFVMLVALPGGFAGATVIAAWLVEEKQSVIENIAPVLTLVFTPLFAVLLLALVVAGAIQRDIVGSDRELLILFDAVLVIVVGLLLYAWSARGPNTSATWFEALQLAMVSAALIIDVYVLIAMIGRIAEFGVSPNKAASLGLNLILLVNLIGAAILLWRLLRSQVRIYALERWQTAFLPVYFVWAGLVVVLFPPLFAFV